MCQPNNASMEETYKAEVECLRKVLAEKDKEIAHLKDLLNVCDKNTWTEKKVKLFYEKENQNA